MPTKTKDGLTSFLLVYASQTGQAKAIAEEIEENAPSHGLHANVQCMGLTEKKFWLERESSAVIISSTTGDGEPPETAQKFWRRLKKKTLPRTHLQNLNYAFLGLGDSNYTNFCNCGKMMDKRLEELGAKRFYPQGWADDAVGLEVVVEPWIDGLWAALRTHLGLEPKDGTECPTVSDSVTTGTEKIENLGVSNEDKENLQISKTKSKVTDQSEDVNINSRDVDSQNKKCEPAISTESASNMKEIKDQTSLGNNCNNNVQGLEKLSEQSSNNGSKNESNNGITPTESSAKEPKTEQQTEHGTVCEEKESLTHSLPPLSESSLTLPLCPPPYLDLVFHEKQFENTEMMPFQNGCPFPSAKSEVTMTTISSAETLTKEGSVKTTLKLELDISNCEWVYKAGDSFGVVCPNYANEVEWLMSRIDYADKADTLFTIELLKDTKKKKPDCPSHVPTSYSLRLALTHCCDIRTVPKKAFLRALVEHTKSPSEKRRLQELCSKQGASHFTKYIREQSVTLLDILAAFPSCKPTPSLLLEQLPRLPARAYSAASSLDKHPGKLQFAFNLIEIPKGDGRAEDRRGLCTGWLSDNTGHLRHLTGAVESLSLDGTNTKVEVPIYLRTNTLFRLPENMDTPIIMIGPGTGIAPFIGFLQERQAARDKGAVLGESWLFFGCRNKEKDFIFRNEMDSFVDDDILSKLCVSFSRDEQDPTAPRYVQDNIRSHAQDIVTLLDEKEAVVFICGDAQNMAKNVNQSFIEILQDQKGITAKQATDFMMMMRLNKRYLEDVWT